MYEWHMPILSTGRARLAVNAVILLAAFGFWVQLRWYVQHRNGAEHCVMTKLLDNACFRSSALHVHSRSSHASLAARSTRADRRR
ncbi:hypothetical protein XHV734_0540 [Xanthomonas hortorum pv. vitians]|nr:hypothetical protein XHV734_0540 [Xanthomonas hortorum pv. vitians]